MDHRTEKTKRSIYNAFIELRAKKPLEKLTVKELCEKAQINKSTFYVYYHDVYHLSDVIENEVISEVVKSLDTKEILTAPADFAQKLFLAYKAQNSLIATVFTGTRAQQLPFKIETVLKETIYTHYPQYKDDIEFNIGLTYCVYGSFYAYNEYWKSSEFRVNSIVGDVSELVLKHLIAK